MPRPRRVLVLAYFFPPLGGAGVQRAVKFVRYLPAHGWTPTVVTTRSTRYGILDPTLSAEVPAGTRVLRAPDVPVNAWIAGFLRRLGLRRAAALVSWPDLPLGWAVAATWRAWREIRRERPDAILTTSAPYSAHLAGWALRRLTGVPWVADFRDEWAANPHTSDEPPARRALSRRAERAVTGTADRIVVVADYFDLAGAPRASPKRVEIPNGVDVDDLPAEGVPADPGVFRLSFVGSIYADQDPEPVLDALRRLAARGAIDPSRVELRVVGNVSIDDFDARSPVPLVRTGYVDHARALAEMSAATALLFYVGPSSLAPSGKLYEYLASQRPLLCVARRENLAFRLVEEWDAGQCATPDDGAGIEAAIASLYDRWRAGTLDPVTGARQRVLERYSRERLAGELGTVLDAVAR